MPAFEKLSEQQIKSLAAFVLTLARFSGLFSCPVLQLFSAKPDNHSHTLGKFSVKVLDERRG
jgi:hypothetical protein